MSYKDRQCQRLKSLYLERCFNQIKRRNSVSQCINLIHSLFDSMSHIYRADIQNSLANSLEAFDTRYDLVELIISEFEDFHRKMVDLTSKRNTDPVEEDKEKVYFGKYSYKINFHNRLTFLEYLVTNSTYQLSLTLKQVERLWDVLALNAIWESDKDFFFSWISRSHESLSYGESSSVITKEVIPDFFEKILCNHKKFDFINVTPKAFECFHIYFKVVNEIKGNFKAGKGSKFVVIDINYEGKESLWSIFLNCKNQSTINRIVALLVNCSLKLGVGSRKAKEEDMRRLYTQMREPIKRRIQ